ncbi:MAG: hypothetical protein JWM86_2389 [Thermoleophilia bacterium]|nr:hypothetical protein [Thermoleophilia bacterium]
MHVHLFVADATGGSWVTVEDRAARAGGLLQRVSQLEHEGEGKLLLGIAFTESPEPPETAPTGEEELVGDDLDELWFHFVLRDGESQRRSYADVRASSIWDVEESFARLSHSANDDVTDTYLGWFVSTNRSADVEAERSHGLHSLL